MPITFKMKYIASLLTARSPAYFRQTFRLALPLLGAHLVEALIPFISTLLAARQGEQALAAVGLASAAFMVMMGFGGGLMISIGILTSHWLGEAQKMQLHIDTGPLLWIGLATAALVSVPVMGILSIMQPVWLWLGQAPELAQLAQDFLGGLKWVVFADFGKFAIFQFAAAHDRPSVPLVANFASVLLAAWVSHGLVERFGLYGLGLGNALAYWPVLLGLLVYLCRSPSFRPHLGIPNSWRQTTALYRAHLKLGVPMGAIGSIELLFFALLSVLMGFLGTDRLAAHQITMQWLWLTIMVAFGFAEAVTMKVAHARGTKDFTGMLGFSHAGIALAAITMLGIACLYWFIPMTIIQLDLGTENASPSVRSLAVSMLAACGFYQIVDSVRFALTGSLRGMADMQYPMWLSMFAFWCVGLPVAWICAFVAKWDSLGVWAGLLIADSLMASLLYIRLRARIRCFSLEYLAS